MVSSCLLIQEEALGVGVREKPPWRELGTEEITELRMWRMVWVITGKAQEAGGGARLVGTVALLQAWMSYSERRKPQAGQPESLPLDWHPFLTFPLPQGSGIQVTSLRIPPGMEYLRMDHALRWMVGTCCLPMTRFQ